MLMNYKLLFIFILDHRNDVRQKTNLSDFFYLSSKWVVKKWKQLSTLTPQLTQELLTNISAVEVQQRLEP